MNLEELKKELKAWESVRDHVLIKIGDIKCMIRNMEEAKKK